MTVSKKTLGRAIRRGVRSGELVAKCSLCTCTLRYEDIKGRVCPGCAAAIRWWGEVRYWHADLMVLQ